MCAQFAQKLFASGVRESEKIQLIYREGPSLPADDLAHVVKTLRADSRYYRLTAALINVTKNENLAIEELFTENAFTPAMVAGFKWMYTTANRGFLNEQFLEVTFPIISYSCQQRIASNISRWVSDTALGDRLWEIVRSRSLSLAAMMFGACSNDLILREGNKRDTCLQTAQVLYVFEKRFSSGVELLELAQDGKLPKRTICRNEVYLFILNRDIRKGVELMCKYTLRPRLGSKLTRRLMHLVSEDPKWESYVLQLVHILKQKTLVRYAPPAFYRQCFQAKFKPTDKYLCHRKMISWLKHLNDSRKLDEIEAWFLHYYRSPLVANYHAVSEHHLFLLDAATLESVVRRKLDWITTSGRSYYNDMRRDYDKELLLWQSMLPDNKESFALQKAHLKGQSVVEKRFDIYNAMLRSVAVLRRPEYLGQRLNYLVTRTRNEREYDTRLAKQLNSTIKNDHRFQITAEVWSGVKEFIERYILLEVDDLWTEHEHLLLTVLNRVELENTVLCSAIMELLNRMQRSSSRRAISLYNLTYAKRLYFWTSALADRESLEKTAAVANGEPCPVHLQFFLRGLARHYWETRDLLKSFPVVLRVLKRVWSPEVQRAKDFSEFYVGDVYDIYQLIKPLLDAADPQPLHPDLVDEIQRREVAQANRDALAAFRKSKVVTESVRAQYHSQRSRKQYLKLCATSLLHADSDTRAQWLTMLNTEREQGGRGKEYKAAFILLAMLSDTSQINADFNFWCPTDKKFKLKNMMIQCQQIAFLASLRYVSDSGVGCALTVPFMVSDYLRFSLSSFDHHSSRLPFKKIASLLRKPMLERESALSPRKVMLHGFFSNVSLFPNVTLSDILTRLAVESEVDEVKRQTLYATYTMVKNVGEHAGWLLLKACLDSVVVDDRCTIEWKLVQDYSIDLYIPEHIDYLMERLVQLSKFETEEESHFSSVAQRLTDNIESLSLQFVLRLWAVLSTRMWNSTNWTMAYFVISYCVPDHVDVFRREITKCGVVCLINLNRLNKYVVTQCLSAKPGKARSIADFLIELWIVHVYNIFAKLRLLELTFVIMNLLPNSLCDSDLLPKLPEITHTALRQTADLLEKFGNGYYTILANNMVEVVKITFPKLFKAPEWTKALIGAYHEGLTSVETMLFLEIVNAIPTDYLMESKTLLPQVEKLGEALSKRADVHLKALYEFYMMKKFDDWY